MINDRIKNERAKVKEAIEKAFADVEYPGDDVVIFVGVEDDEMIEGIDFLRGKHWREVTPATIRKCRDCFLFLPVKAFHFYLPAFMREYLNWEGEREAEQLLVSVLTRGYYELEGMLGSPDNLTGLSKSPRGPRPWPEHSTALSKHHRSLLSHDQAQAILVFLQYTKEKWADVEGFYISEEDIAFWQKTVREIAS